MLKLNSTNLLYVLLFLLFSISHKDCYAQSKKIKRCLDTLQTRENDYLNRFTFDDFYGLPRIQDRIDPKDADQSLMDASVFFAVNLLRKKYKKGSLLHSQTLYKCVLMYTKMHSSTAFDESKDDISAKTIMKYAASKFDYECALLEVKVNLNTIMDIGKKEVYHFDKSSYVAGESEYGLYQGPVELKYDSTVVRKELEFLTYEKFAKSVAQQYLKIIKTERRKHNWTEGSCSVAIDKRSLFTSRLPQAKIIFVFAKKRTALLPVSS